MSVNYLDVAIALSHCMGDNGTVSEEDCSQCPYIEKGCDDPMMPYIALPACLVEDIRTVLREVTKVWTVSSPSKRLS